MNGRKSNTLTMTGINLDLPRFAVPPDKWTGGSNVWMEDGVLTRVRGMAPAQSPPAIAPWHLMFSRIGGNSNWIYSGPAGVGQFNGVAHTDITPSDWPSGAITLPNALSMCVLNGLPIINARTVPPYYWDRVPANDIVHLPGLIAGESYNLVRAFKYFIFGLGITTSAFSAPDAFRWSAAADPGNIPPTWVPGASNEAGDNVLSALDGEIIDGIAYRDQLMLFKRTSIWSVQYTGGQNVFATRIINSKTGCMVTNGVTELNGLLYMITDGDVVRTDGLNMSSVLAAEMRRYLFANVDSTQTEKMFIIGDPAQQRIWICFPEVGQTVCSKAIVVDVGTLRAGIRDLPGAMHGTSGLVGGAVFQDWAGDAQPWGDDGTTWDESINSAVTYIFILCCPFRATTEQFIRTEIGYQYIGTDLYCTALRHSLDMGEPNLTKTVYRVRPMIEAEANIELFCRVGTQQSLNEAIAWGDWQQMTYPNADDYDVEECGRFLSFEFYSTTPEFWSMPGFGVEYRIGGKY